MRPCSSLNQSVTTGSSVISTCLGGFGRCYGWPWMRIGVKSTEVAATAKASRNAAASCRNASRVSHGLRACRWLLMAADGCWNWWQMMTQISTFPTIPTDIQQIVAVPACHRTSNSSLPCHRGNPPPGWVRWRSDGPPQTNHHMENHEKSHTSKANIMYQPCIFHSHVWLPKGSFFSFSQEFGNSGVHDAKQRLWHVT